MLCAYQYMSSRLLWRAAPPHSSQAGHPQNTSAPKHEATRTPPPNPANVPPAHPAAHPPAPSATTPTPAPTPNPRQAAPQCRTPPTTAPSSTTLPPPRVYRNPSGTEAHIRPDGHVQSAYARGMTITHGPGGRMVVNRPDHTVVVPATATSSGRSFTAAMKWCIAPTTSAESPMPAITGRTRSRS